MKEKNSILWLAATQNLTLQRVNDQDVKFGRRLCDCMQIFFNNGNFVEQFDRQVF